MHGIDVQHSQNVSPTVVRVISRNVDPFAGLKGHAYIEARGLNKPILRHVQTSAQLSASGMEEVGK